MVIDPYSSRKWLGNRLPGVEADLALVTHPHYDHNAVWELGWEPVVIDRPVEL